MEKYSWLSSLLSGTSEREELAHTQREHKDKSSSAQLGAGAGSQSLEMAIGRVLAGASGSRRAPRQGRRLLQQLQCVTLEKPWAARIFFASLLKVGYFLYLCIVVSCDSARKVLELKWSDFSLYPEYICLILSLEKKWGESCRGDNEDN